MPLVTSQENFPFHSRDKSVWYFIIDWINRTQLDFYVAGKEDLVQVQNFELKKPSNPMT